MWKQSRFLAAIAAMSVLLLAPAAYAAVSTETSPVVNKKAQVVPNPSVTVATQKGTLPLDELRTFVRVFDVVRTAYVEAVGDKTMLENGIRGMLGELDPHSSFLDEKDFTELQTMTSGEFGGLGIEVAPFDGLIKVIAPIDDTPASRAGIEAGDLIVKIGHKSVQGMSLDEAVNMMRGAAGEPIVLTILRKKVEKPLEIRLVRAVIKVKSVRYKMLAPGFVYLRIAQFQTTTPDEMKKAIEQLQKKGPIKGLVLDLRNNPGGVLQSAVDVSDAFLNKGLIVYTKGRLPDSNTQYSAHAGGDLLKGAPIIVLINDGSASASEIVAGALQDNHRAVLMGTKSFGKGSVQTVIPISDTQAIKLTTARYYTPSGRSIQAEGIKPDIVVERATVTALRPEILAAEADLDRHLVNKNAPPENAKTKSKKAKQAQDNADAAEAETALAKDNQLHDAFNALKAMSLNNTMYGTTATPRAAVSK